MEKKGQKLSKVHFFGYNLDLREIACISELVYESGLPATQDREAKPALYRVNVIFKGSGAAVPCYTVMPSLPINEIADYKDKLKIAHDNFVRAWMAIQ